MDDLFDFAALSNAAYRSRYTPGERERDRATNRHRMEAHRWFDRLWRRGIFTRTEAYRWLAFRMGLPEDDCHMGMMTEAECRTVVLLSKAKLAEHGFEFNDGRTKNRRRRARRSDE